MARVTPFVLLALLLSPVPVVADAPSARVLHDAYTGLALGGRDPVSYFVEREARFGSAEFEGFFNGVHWRFANAGNREAFLAAPEVYQPRYGGFDPTAVAEGRAAAGDPELWAIWRDGLYLFRSAATRAAFVADPAGFARRADAAWPGLARQLPGS